MLRPFLALVLACAIQLSSANLIETPVGDFFFHNITNLDEYRGPTPSCFAETWLVQVPKIHCEISYSRFRDVLNTLSDQTASCVNDVLGQESGDCIIHDYTGISDDLLEPLCEEANGNYFRLTYGTRCRTLPPYSLFNFYVSLPMCTLQNVCTQEEQQWIELYAKTSELQWNSVEECDAALVGDTLPFDPYVFQVTYPPEFEVEKDRIVVETNTTATCIAQKQFSLRRNKIVDELEYIERAMHEKNPFPCSNPCSWDYAQVQHLLEFICGQERGRYYEVSYTRVCHLDSNVTESKNFISRPMCIAHDKCEPSYVVWYDSYFNELNGDDGPIRCYARDLSILVDGGNQTLPVPTGSPTGPDQPPRITSSPSISATISTTSPTRLDPPASETQTPSTTFPSTAFPTEPPSLDDPSPTGSPNMESTVTPHTPSPPFTPSMTSEAPSTCEAETASLGYFQESLFVNSTLKVVPDVKTSDIFAHEGSQSDHSASVAANGQVSSGDPSVHVIVTDYSRVELRENVINECQEAGGAMYELTYGIKCTIDGIWTTETRFLDRPYCGGRSCSRLSLEEYIASTTAQALSASPDRDCVVANKKLASSAPSIVLAEPPASGEPTGRPIEADNMSEVVPSCACGRGFWAASVAFAFIVGVRFQ